MDDTTRRNARVDWSTYLDDFIDREAAGKSEVTRRRYWRVRDHLFDLLAELDVGERADLEVLVECLPTFLDDSWLLGSTTDARTQASLCDRLLKSLRLSGAIRPVTIFRTWLSADAAVFHARVRLRDRPGAPGDARADGRPRLTLIQGRANAE